VIEQVLSQKFVSNDIEILPHSCLLLTGPNMAGKSTIMRQVAISCLLAQIGSFIPASKAKLPIVDHIFTRIGASDQLTEGLSTFMVEMKETSEMVSQATPNSLLILDEIGRGTSTYDGLSLAQSILEHLLEKVGATVLFATHYHELTSLSEVFSQVKNAHMSIHEKGGEIQFLHTLASGPANKSYGIHVAKLAGMPKEVLKRAQVLLKELESDSKGFRISAQLPLLSFSEQTLEEEIEDVQNSLSLSEQVVIQSLQDLSLQTITPLEALNTIAKWQQELS
jgi:DNA mismatch repair protein MutS